jgi:cell wall-associated NlpC family hydrolase
MIGMKDIAPYLQRRLVWMTPAEQFRFYAGLMLGAIYKLGQENPFETDCSGVISWALFCMGYNIRLNAAAYLDRVFTHPVDGVLDYWDHVYAIFFRHGGVVAHVAPILGRGTLFDAVEVGQPAQHKAIGPVVAWYQRNGYEVYFREIDWGKVRAIADAETDVWDREADDLLKELFHA